MIFSKDFLNKVEYYTHSTREGFSSMSDVITLHFKSVWRVKKVIKIRRRVDEIDGDQYTCTQTNECVEALDCLRQHFSSENNRDEVFSGH